MDKDKNKTRNEWGQRIAFYRARDLIQVKWCEMKGLKVH